MEIVFISWVVFMERYCAFDFDTFHVVLKVVYQNVFVFLVLEENVLVEE